jgi:hypothetical protein
VCRVLSKQQSEFAVTKDKSNKYEDVPYLRFLYSPAGYVSISPKLHQACLLAPFARFEVKMSSSGRRGPLLVEERGYGMCFTSIVTTKKSIFLCRTAHTRADPNQTCMTPLCFARFTAQQQRGRVCVEVRNGAHTTAEASRRRRRARESKTCTRWMPPCYPPSPRRAAELLRRWAREQTDEVSPEDNMLARADPWGPALPSAVAPSPRGCRRPAADVSR